MSRRADLVLASALAVLLAARLEYLCPCEYPSLLTPPILPAPPPSVLAAAARVIRSPRCQRRVLPPRRVHSAAGDRVGPVVRRPCRRRGGRDLESAAEPRHSAAWISVEPMSVPSTRAVRNQRESAVLTVHLFGRQPVRDPAVKRRAAERRAAVRGGRTPFAARRAREPDQVRAGGSSVITPLPPCPRAGCGRARSRPIRDPDSSVAVVAELFAISELGPSGRRSRRRRRRRSREPRDRRWSSSGSPSRRQYRHPPSRRRHPGRNR